MRVIRNVETKEMIAWWNEQDETPAHPVAKEGQETVTIPDEEMDDFNERMMQEVGGGVLHLLDEAAETFSLDAVDDAPEKSMRVGDYSVVPARKPEMLSVDMHNGESPFGRMARKLRESGKKPNDTISMAEMLDILGQLED